MARLAGQITDWDDDKGFGFVMPNGGGERTFIHISAFQRGSRRPVAGDFISYLPGKDSRGRLQAREIRHAGQNAKARRPPTRFPRAAIGICALIVAAGAAAIGAIPVLLVWVYLFLSGVSYLMYWFDKSAARRADGRTPENSLHLADLLGGWPGALIAQQQYRHKTAKRSFQWVFWMTVVLNLVGAWWLVWSGTAAGLALAFSG